MIELALWRARVGSFLNIKLIKTPKTISKFTNIQIYFLLLFLITLHSRLRRVKSSLFITIFILTHIYFTFNFASTSDDKVINSICRCIKGAMHGFSNLYQSTLPYLNHKYLTGLITSLLTQSGDIHPNPGPTFNIAHINARSIIADCRPSEIKDFVLDLHKIQILCASETHLDDSIPDSKLSDLAFTIHRRDRTRFGGGVAIFCDPSIPSTRRLDLEPINTEMLWVEINIINKKFLICAGYRPPGQNALDRAQFLAEFEDSVDRAIDEHPQAILLLGDFNDRCLTWSDSHTTSELGKNFLQLTKNLNLHQLITEPTRGTNLLDLFLTDHPELFNNTQVFPPLDGLDHCTIFSTYNHQYNVAQSFHKTIWHYDQGNYADLNNYFLNNLTYDTLHDKNLHDLVLILTETITLGMSTFIPSKTILIKQRDKPWFTPAIRKLFKACHKLHKRKNKTNLPAHILEYQAKHREAKHAFRTAKNNYYNNIASDLQNPETTSKTFWSLLKSLFTKNSTGIPTLVENGEPIINSQQKADLLNSYFASQSFLPPSNNNLPPFSFITDARLDHITITPDSVKTILLNLNTSKSVGPDSINNVLLKNVLNLYAFL